jgi:hypothetical protein
MNMDAYYAERANSLKRWLETNPQEAAKHICAGLGLLESHGGYREFDPSSFGPLERDA